MGMLHITEQYKSEYNQNINNLIVPNGSFDFLWDRILKVDITLNLPWRIVSIYEGFPRKNIVFTLCDSISVTPPPNIKSSTSQRHFSTFYIAKAKMKSIFL